MVEREAALLLETQRWRLEADLQAQEVTQAKRHGTRNAVITGLVCLLGGLITGYAITR
jgi:hypothetical protein